MLYYGCSWQDCQVSWDIFYSLIFFRTLKIILYERKKKCLKIMCNFVLLL